MESEIYLLSNITVRELADLGVSEDTIFTSAGGSQLTQAELTREQAHMLIPDGGYCYMRDAKNFLFKPCPFWDKIKQFPNQGNGYCHYLRMGDDSRGGLLWDQVKECGINYNEEDL